MKRYLMPGTGLWAAPVCLGTGNFKIDQEKHCRDMLDCFVDLGGNLIDTANMYGRLDQADANVSEQILGRWLKDRGQPSDILISTKGGFPRLDDYQQNRLDPASLSADLDSSRKTLDRDCIDLYLIHRDDPQLPVGTILGQLESFRQSGKIKHYGLSNWTAARIQQALDWCAQVNENGLAVVQNRWSLARYNPNGSPDQTMVAMDEATYQLLCRNQLSFMAYSAMAKGFFSKLPTCGIFDLDHPDLIELPEKLRQYYLNDLSLLRAEVIHSIAQTRNLKPGQIVLAWMIEQPFVSLPIVAFSSISQLEEAMQAPAINLTAEEHARLSAGTSW